MSGDPFRKVSSGDRLHIPAAAYNSFIDAAVDFKGRQQNATSRSIPLNSRPGIVRVKNTTGTDLVQFAIVGLDAPLYGSDDSLDEFKSNVTLLAATPSVENHWLKYGILQEPVPADKIGLCLVVGFSVCKLKVNKSWHRYATIIDGETASLESAASGDAIVQWSNADEGATDWALCSIKGGDPVVRWGKTLSNWHNAGDNNSYVDVNPCENPGGDNVETDKTIRVFLPRHGRDEDPNVVADVVIPFIISDPTADPQTAVCVADVLDGKIEVSLKLIVQGGDVPEGWETVSDADKKALCLNENPEADGNDWHGEGINDHDAHELEDHEVRILLPCTTIWEGDKFPANAVRCDTITQSLAHIYLNADGGGHKKTSNWPPYHTAKLIKRIDNSA